MKQTCCAFLVFEQIGGDRFPTCHHVPTAFSRLVQRNGGRIALQVGNQPRRSKTVTCADGGDDGTRIVGRLKQNGVFTAQICVCAVFTVVVRLC